MSYQVFARKYRPRTFADILGQDHVVQTLSNAIKQERLAHAYLFVGPRGTGKTSTARIFAKALNCPGGPKVDFDPDDELCMEIAEGRSLDVLEIDGASNNGVEQVRELRETVNYAPARARFKIYYIDEVHMLSNAAFNALLKTLEEPPDHVKFLFATTEPNKILATILSRCQRFDLRPIPTDIIASHLQFMSDEEGITLDGPAAWAIAKGADGGMRDAQSMLDQLVAFCGKKITEANVQDVFGFTSSETVAGLAASIIDRETAKAFAQIQAEHEKGKDLSHLLAELTGFLRAILIARLNPDAPNEGIPEALWNEIREKASALSDDQLLGILDRLADADTKMRRASNKQLHFEIALIRAVQGLDEVRISDVIKALERAPDSSTPAPQPVAATTPEPAAAPSPTKAEQSPASRRKPKTASPEDKLSSRIESAPESRPDEPEPKPAAEEAKTAKPTPEPEAPPTEGFHDDPLVKEAVRIFEGKLKP